MALSHSTHTTNELPTLTVPVHELLGDGIRRDHVKACPRTGHCRCPYSYREPQEGGKPRKRARIFSTLADARRAKNKATQAAKQRKRAQINRQSGVTPMPTLGEWFDHLMQHEWGQNRMATQDRRRQDFEHRLQSTLGNTRIDKLTPQVIETWMYTLIKQQGNCRSVQAAHETLISLLAVAVRQQLLQENPAKAVRYPAQHIKRKPHRVLTMEQYQQLLAACRNVHERTIIRVLTEGTLRRSELMALQVGDIDLERGVIHVQRRIYRSLDGVTDINKPKNGKTRYAGINDSLCAELQQHLEHEGKTTPTDFVWTRCNQYTNFTTEPYTGSALQKLILTISKPLNLPRIEGYPAISPHVLRATGASIFVAAGGAPHLAQQQLGHAHIKTTQDHYLLLPVMDGLKQFGAVFE